MIAKPDKIDHLAKVVADGFKEMREGFRGIDLRFGTLDGQIEKGFAAIAGDFDDHEHKITSLRASTDGGFLSLRDELREINECLNALDESYKNLKGVTKELDQLRGRMQAIERHLGLERKIAA